MTKQRDIPYVLRAGLSSWGERHREVKGAVRGHQLLLLQDHVQPVRGDTPLPFSDRLPNIRSWACWAGVCVAAGLHAKGSGCITSDPSVGSPVGTAYH